MKITDVRFHPCSPEQRETGLRGWVTCNLDDRWLLDSIAVRRMREGKYTLSFLSQCDRKGIARPLFRPLTTDARVEVERQVLDELRKRGFVA